MDDIKTTAIGKHNRIEDYWLKNTMNNAMNTTKTFTVKYDDPMPKSDFKYKYNEDQIISDFKKYIDKTYGQHYMTEEQNIECFDVWLALGDSMPTFRNTAIKYLWRYGKKNGSNKDDLMKVLHYTMMMLYNDHYKDKK